jgi:ATP-dependent helicase/DNAse subunit B
LIYGPFHPGLEAAFCREVAAARRADPLSALHVLVGSNILGAYLSRMLARSGVSHVNVRFLTFVDLAALAAKPNPERDAPHFADALAAKAALETKPGEYFKPIAGAPGFLGAFLSSCSAAASAGVASGKILASAVEKARFGGSGKKKLLEFARLFDEFRARFGRRFDSREDMILRAAENAAALKDSLESGVLYVYGFYDMNFVQRRLIARAAEHVAIKIFLPYENSPAWKYAAPLFEFFSGFAKGEPAEREPRKDSDLKVLKSRIFKPVEPRTSECKKDGSVCIINAPGESAEVREIAREILRLAAPKDKGGEGVGFFDMAVVLRNSDAYHALVRDIFRESGVTHYFRGGEPLASTPAGSAVRGVIELVSGDFTPAHVAELLSARGRNSVENPPAEIDADTWSRITVFAGLNGPPEEWDGELARFGKTKRIDAPEFEECAACRKFLKMLLESLSKLRSAADWAAAASIARSILKPLLPADIEGRKEAFAILDSIAELDQTGVKPRPDLFVMAAESMLESSAVRGGSFERDGVAVMDIMECRGLSFGAVFIPGLTEQRFPARPAADPILLDEERVRLNIAFAGSAGFPISAGRADEEKILFTIAVQAARERVVLSFPRLDVSSAHALVPSYFLLRTLEAALGRPASYEDCRGAPIVRYAGIGRFAGKEAVSEWEFDLNAVSLAHAGALKPSALAFLFKEVPQFHRSALMQHARWVKKEFTEFDGNAGAAFPFDAAAPLTASMLETYGACPFRYFLRYVLKLDDFAEVERGDLLDGLQAGSIIHDALKRLYERWAEDGLFPLSKVDPRMEKDIAREVRLAADKCLSEESEPPPVFLDVALGRVESLIKSVVEFEAGREDSERFMPRFFEITFGYPERKKFGENALELGAARFALESGETLSFRGRIDRIDVSADSKTIRVVDYKTGKIPDDFRKKDAVSEDVPDPFDGGERLQHAIYLLAASADAKALGVKSSDCSVRSGYYFLKKAEKRREPFLYIDGSRWKDFEPQFRKIAAHFVKGMGSGMFFPYPGVDKANCGNCPYADACEVSVDREFESLRENTFVKTFESFKEVEEDAGE